MIRFAMLIAATMPLFGLMAQPPIVQEEEANQELNEALDEDQAAQAGDQESAITEGLGELSEGDEPTDEGPGPDVFIP